ncbi:hypothetical protein GJAV_G00086480 [Gymnothorax javanicus]|nr:hypothetical protein GJAV_G00086480 [Gymnothorax javanicus]
MKLVKREYREEEEAENTGSSDCDREEMQLQLPQVITNIRIPVCYLVFYRRKKKEINRSESVYIASLSHRPVGEMTRDIGAAIITSFVRPDTTSDYANSKGLEMAPSCHPNITEEVLTLQMVISIPTFIVGLVSNVAVLTIFCCQRRQEWTYMMVYITNMALADCSVLFSLPFKMYSYRNTWNSYTDFCLVLVSIHYVNMYVSIFTVTAISVVRYLGIKYPLRVREIMSPRKAVIVCVLIWTLIGSLSAIFHSVDAPETNQTQFKCFQKITDEPLPIEFIIVLELVGYVLPLATMAFCTARMICTLSTGTMSSSSSNSSWDRTRSIHIIAANLAVFVICFTPFHFGLLLKRLVQVFKPEDCILTNSVHAFTHVSFTIANMNCCLDTFSYYFATKDAWKKLSTCCDSNNRNTAGAVI